MTRANANTRAQRRIEVYADWDGAAQAPTSIGTLTANAVRGKEAFAFEYQHQWLEKSQHLELDPHLGHYGGPQYAPHDRPNFGVFLDSSPDRWGRLIMDRRETQEARREERTPRKLLESDYLLGVHDAHRMGALRFKTDAQDPFLDNRAENAAPPIAALRELEAAAIGLDSDGAEKRLEFNRWLRLLIAPGGSLGGARPKASVMDKSGLPWIAKFPSTRDARDIGAWEMVVHTLAKTAGVTVAPARMQRFASRHHTFLTQRFDRALCDGGYTRIHFASAMTLLGRLDGDSGSVGASYAELAAVLITGGAQTKADLEQLWRRMVFYVCVSNTDDHLRNHGFLLRPGRGWKLAPAYDMNPEPNGDGLRLNIHGNDNALDLDLVREAAALFRVKLVTREAIVTEVKAAVKKWRLAARKYGIAKAEQDRMASAFRLAETQAHY